MKNNPTRPYNRTAELALNAIRAAFLPALHMLKSGDSFCIYGAGEVGELVLNLCKENGLHPQAFLDDIYDEPERCNVPVLSVDEGVKTIQPTSILLATIRASERMQRNLEALPYSGQILNVRDSHSHLRSPHVRFRITPPDKIRRFHNIHEGQRAFVIGNGPSLLKTDPRRLMERNEITFAANNIFLLEGFEPTYYAAIDRVLTQERAKEINTLPWTKFFPHLVSDWITNGIFLNANQREWPEVFSTDISTCLEIDFTVTFSMLQIAFYMGCNPVYLIGVDHTYKIDQSKHMQESLVLTSSDHDPNHFDPSYFGAGYRWNKPRMEPLRQCYNVALTAYQTAGRELYNATAGGALEVLPRVSFESLLDQ